MTTPASSSPPGVPGRLRLPAPVVLVAALVALAWLNRFIQDDAFISFRYARHLAEGHGLVWNPGETPVAGYSTFLWVVLMAAVIALGLDPVGGSWLLGLVLCAATLGLTWRLARDLLASAGGSPGVEASWVVVLLGTNYTFSAWSTGGMETQLQACLVVAATLLTFDVAGAPGRAGVGRLAATSLIYGLLLLTRLDSAVVVAVLAIYAVAGLTRRTPTRGPGRVAAGAALTLPSALLVGGWLSWAWSYYGDVLPNTYYVKVATATSTIGGLHYVFRFLEEYWILPLGLLLLAARPRACLSTLRHPGDERVVVVSAALGLWAVYIVRTGGDFMEFRFVVAVLPLLFVWLWRLVVVLVPDIRLRQAVVVALVAGSVVHAVTFRGGRFGIESVDGLAVHMREEGGDWDEVGRSLRRHFGGPGSDVSVAVGGAGAIPYYSRLPSVDMRGLNDAWVARHGHIVGRTPGHQRMAPFEYLVDREVTLVVGHPQMSRRDAPLPEALTADALGSFGLVDASDAAIPSGARFLVLPVGEALRVTVLYLTPHERVDAVIAARDLPVIPLRR